MLDYRRFREITELFACGKAEQAKFLLMEMQSRYIALRDEMAILKARILTLEESLDLAKNLYSEHGVYWLKAGGLRQGPYCALCYENEGILIKLEKKEHYRACPICGELYILKMPAPQEKLQENTSKIIPFMQQEGNL